MVAVNDNTNREHAATLPTQLLGLAERLARTLAVARALVLAGRPLDLTGFDDGIGMLCAQTLDLPTQDARAMKAVLVGLMESVDSLGGVFRERLRGNIVPSRPGSA